jgi:hypothetical protein
MMNIETLVANLERTIAAKRFDLESIGTDATAARRFVLINIDELKRILKDAKVVQQQVEQLQADLDGFVHGSL